MPKNVYCDSDRPDNTGDGLSPATAKKTPAAAYAITADGDMLLYRSDRFYDPTNGFFPVVRRNNFTVTTYDTGAKPCFDSLRYELAGATGWAHEGSGVWSKAFGNGLTRRVFVGATNTGNRRGQRNPGTGMRRAKNATQNTIESIIANLNADDIWWSSDATLGWRLFIYTGSTTVAPPDFYNGLAIVMADGATTGAYAAVQVQECSNVLIENIESWGSANVAFLVTSSTASVAPVNNVTIRNCVAKYMYLGAAQVRPAGENNTLPRVPISNVLLDGIVGDSATNPLEQEPSMSYTHLVNMDMFSFLDSVTNCRAVNCVSINSFHVSFALGAYTQTSFMPEHTGFENCYMFSDSWNTYTRGATTYGCAPSCYIRRCYFDGQNVRSQLSGSVYFALNTFVNMRLSARSSAPRSGVIGIGAELYNRSFDGVGNLRYMYVVPTGIRIVNNLFVDPQGIPITMETFDAYGYPVPDPTFPDNCVTIANNILLDRAARAENEWLLVNDRSSPVGKQNLWGNVVFKGDGQPVARARRGGTYYNLNTFVGELENLPNDPLVNLTDLNAITLGTTSPCLRAGSFAGIQPFEDDPMFSSRPTIGPFVSRPVLSKPV